MLASAHVLVVDEELTDAEPGSLDDLKQRLHYDGDYDLIAKITGQPVR